jgi:tetratricopeptide (TPR) repeat protein
LSLGLGTDGRLPDDFLERICQQRSSTSSRLRKELSGELEAIVAMALRKESERRYSSVEQFSNDIGCYLDGLPVAARRDTWSYRARKFVARHTIGVALGALAVAALAAFSIATAIQARRIAIERTNAEEVSAFLVDMFEQADPDRARGKEVTVKELLDSASLRVTHDLDDQPATQSRLLATLGTVYGKLGNFDDAERALRESIQLKRTMRIATQSQLAEDEVRLAGVLIEAGKLEEADSLLASALATHQRESGANTNQVGATLHKRARLRFRQERLEESASEHAQAVRILEGAPVRDYPELISTLNDWATLLDYRKDFAGAEALYRKGMQLSIEQLGGDHPFVAQNMHGLAVALAGLGRFDEAQPLYVRSIERFKYIFGNQHPLTAQVLANYGTFLRRGGKLKEAEDVLRQTVALQTAISGPQHVRTAYARSSLALLLVETNRPENATQEFEAALRIYANELPPDHQYIGSSLLGLARALLAVGNAEAATVALVRAKHIATREYPADSMPVASIVAAQGAALLLEGKMEEAESLLLNSYPILISSRGGADLYTVQVRDWITTLYEKQGHREKAAEYFASLPHK